MYDRILPAKQMSNHHRAITRCAGFSPSKRREILLPDNVEFLNPLLCYYFEPTGGDASVITGFPVRRPFW